MYVGIPTLEYMLIKALSKKKSCKPNPNIMPRTMPTIALQSNPGSFTKAPHQSRFYPYLLIDYDS